MREAGIYEWFDILNAGYVDQTALHALFRNLDNYQGPPTTADMIQMLNFITAVRLHQMRESFRQKEEAKKESAWPNWGDSPNGFDGPGAAE